MTRLLGSIALCLGLAFPTWAQNVSDDESQFQRLVEQATKMNVTRNARDTLSFLDSLQNQLDRASPQQRAQLDLIRARSLILITEYDAAMRILEDLIAGDLTPRHRLRAYELAANLAIAIDDHQTGFEYLNRGMELQEQVDDPGLKSGIFGLAAYWHSQLGDQSKGLEYARRTMDLARETGDARELCVAYEKLAQAEEMSGLVEQALARYQEGLAVCEEAGDPVFYGVMHGLMGRVLFNLGRFDEAESWMQQGIALSIDSGFEDGVTDAMTRYGELLLELERNAEAKQVLLDVLDRTRDGSRVLNRAEAHRMLAQISFQEQDYRQASEYLNAHLEAKEQVFDIERTRIIAFQEVQFDMHNQAQEIQLLREQARVSELQEGAMQQQRRFQQILIIMAAFILVLLLLLLIRTLRDRRHFRHMSAHDGLTGLLNHTHFIDTAKTELKQASSSAVTLVLADIDHFKQFNDQHGHQAGDEVLRRTASRFRNVLAPYGAVGRVGGEEFAACLSGLDIDAVVRQVNEVRAALQECRLSDIEQTVTMSFGLAQLQPSESFEELRERADAALYQAKHEGRDRMVIADPAASASS
jgi:diguanylate cyclase (GGDEF)-like protein